MLVVHAAVVSEDQVLGVHTQCASINKIQE